jgi:hypothetical protein
MRSSEYFVEKTIFDTELFCKIFYHFQSASSPREQKVFFNRTKTPGLNHSGTSVVSQHFFK